MPRPRAGPREAVFKNSAKAHVKSSGHRGPVGRGVRRPSGRTLAEARLATIRWTETFVNPADERKSMVAWSRPDIAAEAPVRSSGAPPSSRESTLTPCRSDTLKSRRTPRLSRRGAYTEVWVGRLSVDQRGSAEAQDDGNLLPLTGGMPARVGSSSDHPKRYVHLHHLLLIRNAYPTPETTVWRSVTPKVRSGLPTARHFRIENVNSTGGWYAVSRGARVMEKCAGSSVRRPSR